jgi:hypothetical protein
MLFVQLILGRLKESYLPVHFSGRFSYVAHCHEHRSARWARAKRRVMAVDTCLIHEDEAFMAQRPKKPPEPCALIVIALSSG